MEQNTKEQNRLVNVKRVLNIIVAIIAIVISNVQIIFLVIRGIEDLQWQSQKSHSGLHRTEEYGVTVNVNYWDIPTGEIWGVIIPVSPHEDETQYIYKWEIREFPKNDWTLIEENKRRISVQSEERRFVYRLTVYNLDNQEIGKSYFYVRCPYYNFKDFDTFWSHFLFLVLCALFWYAANRVIEAVARKILRRIKNKQAETKP